MEALRRARVALLALALLIAAALPATTSAKVPSRVAHSAGGCSYTVKDSPTPVHAQASGSSPVVRWKYRGDVVTGPCSGVTILGGGPTQYWIEVYCSAGPGGYAWIDASHLYNS